MNVVVRADASLDIGSGHLMRCLTLADQLRSEGTEVAFICCDLPGEMFDLLHNRGYRFSKLPLDKAGKNSQQFDAEQTIKAAGKLFSGIVDWLVVDHYQLDAAWERLLRPHVCNLMVIDDLADRKHDCDVLLDQNLHRVEMETRYDKLILPNCKKLLGPKYALLRPEFKEARSELKVRDGSVKRIFVFFGGSDSKNGTAKALRAIQQIVSADIAIDVVVGSTNPHLEDIAGLCSVLPDAKLHLQINNIAELMSSGDLSVGAGGATTWERMCLGLPSIVMSVADNQRTVSHGLAQAGLIEYIGSVSDVRDIDLIVAIKRLIENKNQRLSFSSKTQLLVDGLGAARITDILAAN